MRLSQPDPEKRPHIKNLAVWFTADRGVWLVRGSNDGLTQLDTGYRGIDNETI